MYCRPSRPFLGILITFFMQPCNLEGKESNSSIHQLLGSKERVRRSLKTKQVEECVVLYHMDAIDPEASEARRIEMFPKDPDIYGLPPAAGCETNTETCYRGICVEGDCICCPPITKKLIQKYNNKKLDYEDQDGEKKELTIKISPPYGRWKGGACAKFKEGEFDDDDDDDDSDSDANSGELIADGVPDAVNWQKDTIRKDINANERPVPTKEDKKNQRDECYQGTASCWRGTCNDKGECECFKYQETSEQPGTYVGKFCDSFVEDSFYQAVDYREHSCKDDQPSTCKHGFCLEFEPEIKICYCGRGYTGPRCSIKVNKCPECLNGRCKSKRTLLGKVKFCECYQGWAGYACERPHVCLQPGTLKDLCITGTCRRKSKKGKKLQYCDCPASKQLKNSGPFCKPHNYSPGKYGADAKCNGKWTCVNGFCKKNKCQCNDGYISKSAASEKQCDTTCTEDDPGNQRWGPNCENPCALQNCLDDKCLFDTGDCAKYMADKVKVFTGCKAGFEREGKTFRCVVQKALPPEHVLQDVPIKQTFAGEYNEALQDDADQYARIEKAQDKFLGAIFADAGADYEVNGLYGMTISPGSVVLDMTARVSNPEDIDTNLQEIIMKGIQEKGDSFDGGLGEGYKLDKTRSTVGKPRLLSSGEDESNNKSTIGYSLVGVTFFFIMICIFVVIKTKMDHKEKAKNKKDNKDSKQKSTFKKKSGSKISRASSKKSETMKSKKSPKSVKSSQA